MKVLFIAPNAYPVNGAEEICNIKLLRAMSEDHGFIVDIVSRKRNWTNYPSDSLDSYGVVANSLHIIESDNRVTFKTIIQTICCLFVFGVAFKGCIWAYVALPCVKKLVKENEYDLVITKNSPSLLLGSYLKKKGLKWVGSWNDPFPKVYYPFPYGKGKDAKGTIVSRRLVKIMETADAHVFPSGRLRDHMLHYMKVDFSKTWVAPHIVFENKDNKNNKNNCFHIPSKKGTALRIIHSGNLSFPRDPSTFFIALNEVLNENPSFFIEFTILGRMDNKSMEMLSNLKPLRDHFVFHEPIEYKESLAFLRNFDVACIIEANCGVGGGVFLPTKVSDFIQSQIPILAVSPKDGVLEDLFEKGTIGYFADVSSIISIKNTLLSIYSDYLNNRIKGNTVDEEFTPQKVTSVYKSILRAIQ